MALLVGSFLTLAVAACGGSSDDSTTAGTSDGPERSEVSEASIDTEATLRVGTVTMVNDWDPHKERESGERKLLWQVWDRLIMLDVDNNLQPGIATDWEFSEDGDTLTLTLREGVEFRDGTPVDAEAVKASLERAKSLDGSTVAADLETVEEIEVVDDHTVDLHLNAPSAFLPLQLSFSAGAVISPQAIEDGVDIASDPNEAASGPFLVEDFVPRESAELVRDDEGDYWDSEALNVARIEFRNFSGDPQAGISAIQAGELDYLTVLSDPESTEASIAGSDLVLEIFPTSGTYGFWINPHIEPTDDIRVREAILMGTDRATVGAAVGGDDSYATTQLVPEGQLGYDPDYDPFPYDPEAAQELLDEAGYGDGLEIELIHPAGYAPAEISALAAQEQLAEIGIDVTISPLAPADFTPTWNAGDTPTAISATGGEADTYILMNLRFFGGQRLAAPDAEEDLRAAMEQAADPTLDDAETEEAYKELTRVAIDQATFGPIGFRPGQALFQPQLLGAMEQPLILLSDTANIVRYLAIANE